MKGLLYKDFVLFKKSFFALGLVAAFVFFLCSFGITSAAISAGINSPEDTLLITSSNVAGFFCIFILLTPLSSGLFTPDEKPTTIGFLFSTPQAAKGQIQSKYFFLLLVNLGMLFACFIVDTIMIACIGEYASSLTSACMIFFCINLILLSIRVPFHVRFGSAMSFPVQVAGFIIIISGIIIYALFGNISFFFEDFGGKAPLIMLMEYFQSEKVIFVLSLIPYISVLMYYLSYRISLALYRKGVETYEQ